MPSIIPALPVRPTTVNFPSKVMFGPNHVVSAGSSLLATDLALLYEANPYSTIQWTEFTNHGTIWSDPTVLTSGLTFGVIAFVDRIIIDGTIVLVVDNFPDYDY